MPVTLTANALTTLDTVKTDLSISVTTFDEQLKRLINAASDQIERFCNRIFYRDTEITEKVKGYGGTKLLVSRAPINSIDSITYRGVTVQSTDYEIGNANAGVIEHLSGGWNWSNNYRRDVSSGALPGTEEQLYTVVYDGGWYTQEQKDGGAATRDLPWDLENACIDLVRYLYKAKSRDPGLKGEKIGEWSADYAVTSTLRDGMPVAVADTLERYRRVV